MKVQQLLYSLVDFFSLPIRPGDLQNGHRFLNLFNYKILDLQGFVFLEMDAFFSFESVLLHETDLNTRSTNIAEYHNLAKIALEHDLVENGRFMTF